MPLTIKQLRGRAQKLILKEIRYKMRPRDVDELLNAVIVGEKTGFPEISRESIVIGHLKKHMRQYPKSDRDRFKRIVLGEQIEEGDNPHEGESIKFFLPEAIKTLQEVERIGTAIKPKIELLKSVKSNPVLQDIFRLAYDWQLAYGIGEAFEVDMKVKGGGTKSACKAWPLFVEKLNELNQKPASNQEDQDRLRFLLEKMPRPVRKWAYRVLMRDLKIGMKDGNIRRVWRKLLPKFDVTLCSTIKRGDGLHAALEDLPNRLWIEPKFDGLRTLVAVEDAKKGVGKVYSRRGRVQDHLQYLVEEACRVMTNQGMVNGVLDCEAVSTKSNKYSDAVSAKTTQDMEDRPLRLMVFDVVPLDEFNEGLSETPQETRREVLEEMFENAILDAPSFRLAPGKSVGRKDRHKRIMYCYDRWRREGYEGVVIKDKEAQYKAGDRNRKKSGYYRIKPFETKDVKVIGFFPGKKGTKYEKMLGGLICKKGKSEIRVGGGFKDKERKEFWENRKKMVGMTIEIELQEGIDEEHIKARHAHFRRLRLKQDK